MSPRDCKTTRAHNSIPSNKTITLLLRWMEQSRARHDLKRKPGSSLLSRRKQRIIVVYSGSAIRGAAPATRHDTTTVTTGHAEREIKSLI